MENTKRMIKILLEPLKGIKIEGASSIEFNMSRLELEAKLGKPDSIYDNKLFYEELELRMDLDKNQRLEFIEFIYGPVTENIEVEIYGLNPFKTKSSDLIEVLKGHNTGLVDSTEEPYCYAFHGSSVGIYRNSCEAEVADKMAVCKANSENPEQEEWFMEAHYFWTIGIGRKGYYGLSE